MAFLKNDPSATHLGDIGSIFGNNAENQIAQRFIQNQLERLKNIKTNFVNINPQQIFNHQESCPV